MSNESPASILFDENSNRVGVAANPIQVTGFPNAIGVTGSVQGVVGVTGPVRVDRVGITGPVQVAGAIGITGPVAVSNFPAGFVAAQGSFATNANAWPVKLTDASNVIGVPTFPVATRGPRSSNATVAPVAGSTSSFTLLAANANRIGASLYNGTNRDLYVKLGITASTSSYTVKMVRDAYYELPYGYTGRIDGISDTGVSGNVLVTEYV